MCQVRHGAGQGQTWWSNWRSTWRWSNMVSVKQGCRRSNAVWAQAQSTWSNAGDAPCWSQLVQDGCVRCEQSESPSAHARLMQASCKLMHASNPPVKPTWPMPPPYGPRLATSSLSMICMADTLGAPDTVPAGSAARNASHASSCKVCGQVWCYFIVIVLHDCVGECGAAF